MPIEIILCDVGEVVEEDGVVALARSLVSPTTNICLAKLSSSVLAPLVKIAIGRSKVDNRPLADPRTTCGF